MYKLKTDMKLSKIKISQNKQTNKLFQTPSRSPMPKGHCHRSNRVFLFIGVETTRGGSDPPVVILINTECRGMCGSRGPRVSWSLLGSAAPARCGFVWLVPRLRTCCRLHPVRREQAQLPSASAGGAGPGFSGASGFPPDHLIT